MHANPSITYPLHIRRRHHRPKHGEIVVHLLPPIAFHSNVCHSLILHFFLVLGSSGAPSFSLAHCRCWSFHRRQSLTQESMISDIAILWRGGSVGVSLFHTLYHWRRWRFPVCNGYLLYIIANGFKVVDFVFSKTRAIAPSSTSSS